MCLLVWLYWPTTLTKLRVNLHVRFGRLLCAARGWRQLWVLRDKGGRMRSVLMREHWRSDAIC